MSKMYAIFDIYAIDRVDWYSLYNIIYMLGL